MNKIQRWLSGALGLAAKADIPLSRVQWSTFGNPSNPSGQYSDTPDGWVSAAHSNVWARNCIRARASAIAQTELKLKQYNENTGEETEITKHEILDLLETVNPINSNKQSFRRSIETQLGIHGDCIVKKAKDTSKRVRELYLLPRQYVQPEPDANTFIGGYTWLINGELIPKADCIRFWYPHPDGSIMAESPTSTALRYINPYNISDLAAEAIDKRGGQGGGIVSYDALANGIDLERMKSEWDRKYSDPKMAGADRHMPPGTKYESGALTAQQMQREERMIRLAQNIMGSYFVPPAIAGDYSDASVLANAAVQSRAFWDLFVLDELSFIAETFNNELLWADWPGSYEAGLYLEHDVSEIAALQEDADAKMQRAVIGVQGGILSVNEGREMADMEPVDDPNADAVNLMKEQPAPQPAQPPQQMPTQQPDMQPAARAVPWFDFVGMTAILSDGTTGAIESIKRFGEHGTLTATADNPVLIVRGAPVAANTVRVMLHG